MSHPVWQVGDRNPSIAQTITVNDEAYDLTGVDEVRFKMRAVGEITLKVNAVATIVTPPGVDGEVRYDWAAADVDTGGMFLAWWEVWQDGDLKQSVGETLIEFREHATVGYIELEQVKATLGITRKEFADPNIQRAIRAASAAIDTVTQRPLGFRLSDSSADDVRYYQPQTPYRVVIDDLASLTTLEVDTAGDGTFTDEWTANTDFVLEPLNAAADGIPYELVAAHPRAAKSFPAGWPRSVRVTGRFGWLAVPDAVEQACEIIATKLVKRAREAPFAIIPGNVDVAAIRLARHDPEVQLLLETVARRTVL